MTSFKTALLWALVVGIVLYAVPAIFKLTIAVLAIVGLFAIARMLVRIGRREKRRRPTPAE